MTSQAPLPDLAPAPAPAPAAVPAAAPTPATPPLPSTLHYTTHAPEDSITCPICHEAVIPQAVTFSCHRHVPYCADCVAAWVWRCVSGPNPHRDPRVVAATCPHCRNGLMLNETFRPNRGRWLEDQEMTAGEGGEDETGSDGAWYDDYMDNLEYMSDEDDEDEDGEFPEDGDFGDEGDGSERDEDNEEEGDGMDENENDDDISNDGDGDIDPGEAMQDLEEVDFETSYALQQSQ